VLDVACPDCPARAVYITEIAATPMAPWLVRTEAREAATGTAERPPEAFGRCTGCGESIRLTDGMIPPHMWPYSTPLLIACSGGGQAPAESNTQAGETT
jgi:hypothetical protein